MLAKHAAALSGSGFQWNLWTDFQNMWQYAFMQHAFEAGTIVAIVAGVAALLYDSFLGVPAAKAP